jgi:hypothetical protein
MVHITLSFPNSSKFFFAGNGVGFVFPILESGIKEYLKAKNGFDERNQVSFRPK